MNEEEIIKLIEKKIGEWRKRKDEESQKAKTPGIDDLERRIAMGSQLYAAGGIAALETIILWIRLG